MVKRNMPHLNAAVSDASTVGMYCFSWFCGILNIVLLWFVCVLIDHIYRTIIPLTWTKAGTTGDLIIINAIDLRNNFFHQFPSGFFLVQFWPFYIQSLLFLYLCFDIDCCQSLSHSVFKIYGYFFQVSQYHITLHCPLLLDRF